MASWAKTFVVDDQPNVVMRSNLGQVRIASGQARQVSVEAHDHGIRLPLFGAWEVRDLHVCDLQVPSRIQLDVKFPRLRYFGGFVLPLSSISLTAPHLAGVDVETWDGRIVLDRFAGHCRLLSGSGSIRAAVDGDLDATAHNGGIRATGRFGVLNLHSHSGNISVEVEPGSPLTSEWRIATLNGSIEFRCPPGLAAEIDADAGGGRVFNGSTRTSTYRGTWNGGGPLIHLRCSNGNIRILPGRDVS